MSLIPILFEEVVPPATWMPYNMASIKRYLRKLAKVATVGSKGHSTHFYVPVRRGKNKSKSRKTVFKIGFLATLLIPQTLFRLIVSVVEAQMRIAIARGQVARAR